MFLFDILIWIRKEYRCSYGKIISKFYLLDPIKVSWKLLWRFIKNRSPIYTLFLVLMDL